LNLPDRHTLMAQIKQIASPACETLPCNTAIQNSPRTRTALDDARAMDSKDRILIVDDDPEIRQLLVDYLARNGFDAVPAANGRDLDTATRVLTGADIQALRAVLALVAGSIDHRTARYRL